MKPSDHTRLMNYIIGMCKKHKEWITVLNDLGYNVSIIEQRIRTSSGEAVTPDIIITSNKLIHSLVFECKGGTSVDAEQMRRYGTLSENDFRWVNVYTFDNFHFDVCVTDIQENHTDVMFYVKNQFPIITFSDDELSKTGEFNEKKLNKAFEKPINLKGKTPPLSYYPFSEMDEKAYIIPFVMRGLVTVAIKKAKSGSSVFDRELITSEEIMENVFNPVFKTLSKKHQGRLKEKVKDVMRLLLSRKETKEALGIIERRAGYAITNALGKLMSEAEKIEKRFESQQYLPDYPSKF